MKLTKINFKKLLAIFIFSLAINNLYGGENQSTGIDTSGNIAVVWQENSMFSSDIKATVKPVSGSWEIPVTLSTSSTASLPKIAVCTNNPNTTFVAAIWIEIIGGVSHLYGAMRPDILGGWTTATLISDGTEDVLGNYELLVNSAGELVATWSSNMSGTINLRASTGVIDVLNLWTAPTTLN